MQKLQAPSTAKTNEFFLLTTYKLKNKFIEYIKLISKC